MKDNMGRFYTTFGDRGVMFIMFAFSVVLNALLSIHMELPAVSPDEIGVAAVARMYSGGDWSSLMGSIGYYYGYIQAIFYAPLFLIFSSPYALYKSMLVMNGVLISLIPLIAYHLASKLGIIKVWQKLVISLCCGGYITYIAHSKFIWNEAISSVLPWLLAWCLFMAWDRKSRFSKFIFSLICGIVCAVCYAAHSRLIAVVIAAVLTVFTARIFFKEKMLNLPAFLFSLAGSFIGEHFAKDFIQNEVWGKELTLNTMEDGIGRISGILTEDGIYRFFAVLFGHIYTFMTSTLGIGAVACAVFAVICWKRITEWNMRRSEIHADGTKVYEPVKHLYGTRITMFGIYAFLTVGGSLLLSALYKFNSHQFSSFKDLPIFGRYVDNVAPLAVFLALAFLFLYGYSVKRIIAAAGIYAYVCLGFRLLTYHYVMDASTYRESPVLGLMPWRIGEDYTEPFGEMSFIIMSSMTFAFLALIIVIISCSKAHRSKIISGAVCCVFIYTTVFTGAFYLPMRAEKNESRIKPAEEVTNYIYNEPNSPQIIAYGTSVRTASLIQFLTPDVPVSIIKKKKNIPENCIIIAENNGEQFLEEGEYDIIGTTKEYIVYAYGESARDYIKYKKYSGEEDNESADE